MSVLDTFADLTIERIGGCLALRCGGKRVGMIERMDSVQVTVTVPLAACHIVESERQARTLPPSPALPTPARLG